MSGPFQGRYHANQLIKPQELNISSATSKTETEQKKRKPQWRVEDRYYTIQKYKALSNEQKKELKDFVSL